MPPGDLQQAARDRVRWIFESQKPLQSLAPLYCPSFADGEREAGWEERFAQSVTQSLGLEFGECGGHTSKAFDFTGATFPPLPSDPLVGEPEGSSAPCSATPAASSHPVQWLP